MSPSIRPGWSSCSQTSGGLLTRVRLAVFMVRAFVRPPSAPAPDRKWEIPPAGGASARGGGALLRRGADLVKRQLGLLAERRQVEVDRLALHQAATEGRHIRERNGEPLARRWYPHPVAAARPLKGSPDHHHVVSERLPDVVGG